MEIRKISDQDIIDIAKLSLGGLIFKIIKTYDNNLMKRAYHYLYDYSNLITNYPREYLNNIKDMCILLNKLFKFDRIVVKLLYLLSINIFENGPIESTLRENEDIENIEDVEGYINNMFYKIENNEIFVPYEMRKVYPIFINNFFTYFISNDSSDPTIFAKLNYLIDKNDKKDIIQGKDFFIPIGSIKYNSFIKHITENSNKYENVINMLDELQFISKKILCAYGTANSNPFETRKIFI